MAYDKTQEDPPLFARMIAEAFTKAPITVDELRESVRPELEAEEREKARKQMTTYFWGADSVQDRQVYEALALDFTATAAIRDLLFPPIKDALAKKSPYPEPVRPELLAVGPMQFSGFVAPKRDPAMAAAIRIIDASLDKWQRYTQDAVAQEDRDAAAHYQSCHSAVLEIAKLIKAL